MEVRTFSQEETKNLASDLAQTLHGGDIIALFGDLGAGKTVFAQGLALGFGIKRRILSPTFVFVRFYPFVKNGKKLIFYHIDLYRGQKLSDFEVLGLAELFSLDSVVVIEWAEKIQKNLPKKRINVYIKKISKNIRQIKIER